MLAKTPRVLRSSRLLASSLTIFASKLAPTGSRFKKGSENDIHCTESATVERYRYNPVFYAPCKALIHIGFF
ncbi:hypothetical protein C1Y18_02355 [Pseudomonas sp. MPR-R5A]|nr:hypothetical protein C1Y25_00810 [Pseudomonas sp. MPBC4-3]PMX50138.1 hypothetical protein C1Y20_04525 [Pseudomonas sp. FW301-21B01]PMY10854.1 hypothetical protein C1Y18_02355 [Pseudomonas sp. MPR-R5A]PNA73021.1 hypothetical protein C1Y14_01910 [Pseudomonas sp. MPR-R5B]